MKIGEYDFPDKCPVKILFRADSEKLHCLFIERCILPKEYEFYINCILFKYEKDKIK